MRLARLAAAAAALALAGVAAAQPAPDAAQVARGRYLATAADCVACHSLPGKVPFTGGNAFKTPFGTIYAPNITPDRATGIGAWSDADFLRALREGVGPNGQHYYPAFPYTQFTGIGDADALAIKAYLFSLKPVRRAPTPNAMKFPYNIRLLMAGWKLVNFREGRFVPDPAQSAEMNRGRYLATSLGHCNECHTPRTLTMGLDDERGLAGGVVDGWQAYNITPDAVSGIGAWSLNDIVAYLRTGHLDNRAQAAGPMAEVVSHSLRFLTPADLRAIAVYLKAQPAIRAAGAEKNRHAFGRADADRTSFSGTGADPAHPAGRAIYAAACAACHALDGSGLPGHATAAGYPSMIGNSVLGADSADNFVLTLLNGVARDGPEGTVFMPSFGSASVVSNSLSDEEIASLAGYAFRQFGNPKGAEISPARVAQLRTADVAGWTLVGIVNVAMIAVALLVATLVAFKLRRRRLGKRAGAPTGEARQ